MPKTIFTNGTFVSSAYLNAVNNPQFDGQDLDGHSPPLTDASLSSAAGNIKPEWQGFRDALKCSAGTGLSVNYQGGAITLPNGEVAAIAPGSISLVASATNYIYVRDSGVVEVGLSLPSRCVPLAKISTIASAISGNIIDLRPRFNLLPLSNAIKIFGGTGDEGDYTLTTTATFNRGFYYFRNFTIQAGATLTIDKFARIFCSGNVTINGIVVVSSLSSGGAAFATQLTGNIGGLSGSGAGGGSGSSGVGGQSYNYAAAPYGSGGGSGFCVIDASSGGSGQVTTGGKGGGGIWIEAAGLINCSGSISAKGENGGNGIIFSVSGSSSGGGGGSGGLILLSSLRSVSVNAAASFDVRGGVGGNGVGNGDGGAGGGGGQIVLLGTNINFVGTALLGGGAKGTPAGTGGLGGGAGGGFGGNGGGQSAGSIGQLITRNIIPIGN